MKLRNIVEDATSVVQRLHPAIRYIARDMSRYYSPTSLDRSMIDDLYQVAMTELVKVLQTPQGQAYANNDKYLMQVARRAMIRGGKKDDGTKIGRTSQIMPTFLSQSGFKKAEYETDPRKQEEWDVDKIPADAPDMSKTQVVREIISNWPEREQFIIQQVMAGMTGKEIAELEAKQYGRPKPVSNVAVSKWVAALKQKLQTELAAAGIMESVDYGMG